MHTLRWLWICTCLLFLTVAIQAQDDICINTDEGYLYHVERAGYLRGMAEYDAALFHYQCAYLIDSEALPVVRGIGYVNIELGQLNTALPYFQTAMTLAPDDAISNFDLGRMIALQAERDIRNGVDYNELLPDFQQAVAYYNRAEELDPRLSVVYYNRGVAYYDVKNYAAAIRELQHALELQVKPVYRTQFVLATLYYEQNEYDSAWDYYQRSVLNSDGKYTLEDVIPPGLTQYKTNTEIERFAKRNLPIVLFILVSLATLAYVLIKRLRRFWGRSPIEQPPSSSPTNDVLEASAPQQVQVLAPILPTSETTAPPQAPSDAFPWWQTILFVPVVVGGIYAIQRWLSGDES